MIVRIAEAAGLELVDVNVELTGLARVAEEIGLIGGDPIGRISPLELLGRHIRHGCRIELDGVAGCSDAHDGRNGKREVRQWMLCEHGTLPVSTLRFARGMLDAAAGAWSSV